MNREQMEKVWPGCEYCTKQVETRKEVGWDDSGDAICIESNDTLAVIGSDSWEFLANYCPMCGSPITPAAWAVLKKRLEAADDGKTLVKNLPPGARLEWKGMMWTVIDRDKRGIVILGDKEIPREEIQKLQKESDDGK